MTGARTAHRTRCTVALTRDSQRRGLSKLPHEILFDPTTAAEASPHTGRDRRDRAGRCWGCVTERRSTVRWRIDAALACPGCFW